MQVAHSVFKYRNIKITAEGQRHLGAVTGLKTLKQKYVQEKIDQWIKKIHVLFKIAWCEPQSAYSGLWFNQRFKHKLIYFMRTIMNTKIQLKELDDVIKTEFLPAITAGINCSDIERRLMSLPPRFGGLGFPILSESSQKEYQFSTIL